MEQVDLYIRKCEERDEEIWTELNREFMNCEIQDDEAWNDTQKKSDTVLKNTFREALDNPDLITLFLFEHDGEIIGFANLMTIYSIWAHGKALILDDLFLQEKYRGKGFGRGIMEYLENYARNKGYKRLQFQSEFSNAGALAFYKKIGFAPVDMHFYLKYF